MYSADSGGLHTDVYLVGLYSVFGRFEQYLALEMQLESKLGTVIVAVLSRVRHAAYRDTNLPSSPFDCRVSMI